MRRAAATADLRNPSYQLPERLALEILHDEVRRPILATPTIEHLDDVRVTNRLEQFDLAEQSLRPRRGLRLGSFDDLDGDVRPGLHVERLVHTSGPALAEHAQDLVTAAKQGRFCHFLLAASVERMRVERTHAVVVWQRPMAPRARGHQGCVCGAQVDTPAPTISIGAVPTFISVCATGSYMVMVDAPLPAL